MSVSPSACSCTGPAAMTHHRPASSLTPCGVSRGETRRTAAGHVSITQVREAETVYELSEMLARESGPFAVALGVAMAAGSAWLRRAVPVRRPVRERVLAVGSFAVLALTIAVLLWPA